MAQFRFRKAFGSGMRRAYRNPAARRAMTRIGKKAYGAARKRGGARTKRALAVGSWLYANRSKIKGEYFKARDMFYGSDDQEYNQRGFAKKSPPTQMAGSTYKVHKGLVKIGSNGRKLRQLEGLYGSSSRELRNSKNDGIETGNSAISPFRETLSGIEGGFNQKVWVFPLHHSVETGDMEAEFQEISVRGQVDTQSPYGHILNFKRKLTLSSSNSFLDMMVNVYTCKMKDTDTTIVDLYDGILPTFTASPSRNMRQVDQGAIPDVKLLEEGLNSTEISTRDGHIYSQLEMLVDPDTRLDSSRFFEDKVSVLKKSSYKLGPGDVLEHRNENHPKKAIPLDGIFRQEESRLEDHAIVGTFDIIEVVGKKCEGWTFTGSGGARAPYAYIGTAPVKFSLEFQTKVTGVLNPKPANSNINNYRGTFSFQVFEKREAPLRIGNLPYSAIGSYEQAVSVATANQNIHMYIPVSTDEHVRFAHGRDEPRVAIPVASQTDNDGDGPN